MDYYRDLYEEARSNAHKALRTAHLYLHWVETNPDPTNDEFQKSLLSAVQDGTEQARIRYEALNFYYGYYIGHNSVKHDTENCRECRSVRNEFQRIAGVLTDEGGMG